jgi:hypothetical protein
MDHEDTDLAWCPEKERMTCARGVMCHERLAKRELLELLLERTEYIINRLYAIEEYIDGVKREKAAIEQEARREKWESERPDRIRFFEEKVFKIGKWVNGREAAFFTGMAQSTLKNYANKGKLRARRNEKGRREYLVEDLLPYIEKQKSRIESGTFKTPGY